VVVHSAKTTIGRVEYLRASADRVVVFVPLGGESLGEEKARRIAVRREMCSTSRVLGYEAVKMGSKIAAR
jgi:hypothetical protein